MGRKNADRHISFNYDPKIVAIYDSQTEQFKTKCEELGAPYGYTGMNVFYTWYFWYMVKKLTGNTFTAWEKTS